VHDELCVVKCARRIVRGELPANPIHIGSSQDQFRLVHRKVDSLQGDLFSVEL
jgi:hypothetical protein